MTYAPVLRRVRESQLFWPLAALAVILLFDAIFIPGFFRIGVQEQAGRAHLKLAHFAALQQGIVEGAVGGFGAEQQALADHARGLQAELAEQLARERLGGGKAREHRGRLDRSRAFGEARALCQAKRAAKVGLGVAVLEGRAA